MKRIKQTYTIRLVHADSRRTVGTFRWKSEEWYYGGHDKRDILTYQGDDYIVIKATVRDLYFLTKGEPRRVGSETTLLVRLVGKPR